MKIKIELNTKELSSLVGDSKEAIPFDFEIDLYTESRKEISKREETSIFTGIFWALCTMLPPAVIQNVFKKWNEIVQELNEGLKEGKQVSIKVLDK